MYANLAWNGRPLQVDLSAGRSLAIRLDPAGPQPAFFTSVPMRAEALRERTFIGDVRRGGSCNAEVLHWAPHCHGTHTEGIGHILPERPGVLDCIDTEPVLACLLTVTGEAGRITRTELERGWSRLSGDHAALILRTLPNPPGKQWRNYAAEPHFPVIDAEAMAWLVSRPLRHLLLDTPSLDSPQNERMENHRTWWGQYPSAAPHGYPPHRRSVTEMVYVADEIADGEYWLHLELSPLVSDATPSRPVIYPVNASPMPGRDDHGEVSGCR
jgi:kynurenine formamidase